MIDPVRLCDAREEADSVCVGTAEGLVVTEVAVWVSEDERVTRSDTESVCDDGWVPVWVCVVSAVFVMSPISHWVANAAGMGSAPLNVTLPEYVRPGAYM